jgi:hypothetical protein
VRACSEQKSVCVCGVIRPSSMAVDKIARERGLFGTETVCTQSQRAARKIIIEKRDTCGEGRRGQGRTGILERRECC